MSSQFPVVQDTIVAVLVIVAIAVALSVAFSVAASFFQRSNAGSRRAVTNALAPVEVVPAAIEHPTPTDGTRELALR